jgi:hypothetical protein
MSFPVDQKRKLRGMACQNRKEHAGGCIKMECGGTCNAADAGKWRSEQSAFLSGGDAIIVPDNDQRRRSMPKSAAQSLRGIAARIRIEQFGSPEKYDIIDGQAAGHTREELDGLVAAAADWRPKANGYAGQHLCVFNALILDQMRFQPLKFRRA